MGMPPMFQYLNQIKKNYHARANANFAGLLSWIRAVAGMTNVKALSTDLTTQDVFKAAAVLIMIVDHIGFYLMTEHLEAPAVGDPALWWRVVGRLCVPIWFFWIGYSESRKISWALLGGAVLLVLANIVTGMFIFPLNVLWSMIFIRLILTPVARFAFSTSSEFAGVVTLCLLLLPLTNHITEYGTLGLLMALAGTVTRQMRNRSMRLPARMALLARWILVVLAGLGQAFLFPMMSEFQFWIQFVGMTLVYALLFTLAPTTYPQLTQVLPPQAVQIIQFMGRHTILIYVIHLILLKVIALVFGLGYPIYGWMDWDWTIAQAFSP